MSISTEINDAINDCNLFQKLPKDIINIIMNFLNECEIEELIFNYCDQEGALYYFRNKILKKHVQFIAQTIISVMPDFNKFFEITKEAQQILIDHILSKIQSYLNGNDIKVAIEITIKCSELYYFANNSQTYEDLANMHCTEKNEHTQWFKNTMFPKTKNPYEMFYYLLNYRRYIKGSEVYTYTGFKQLDILEYTKLISKN